MAYTLQYSSRVLVGLGLAGLLVISQAAPVFSTETTITVTILAGPRTVTINPDFVTSNVTYSEKPQTTSGSASITVEDLSGTGEGWHITLQASDLVYNEPNGDSSIPAENLAVTSASMPVTIAGQPVDAPGGPGAPDSATGPLDQPRKVLQADPDHGQGSYNQALDLTLTIPAMSQAGSYSGTLIVSIVAGP